MILAFDNSEKTYGQTVALRGVSFEVDSGEIFGLLGPNGAGKSTHSRNEAVADVRIVESDELLDSDRRAVRALLDRAFAGDFSDADWRHALGGWHAIIGSHEAVLAHAALVERRIVVGQRQLRAGYIEAVAVAPGHQRTGLGTVVMKKLHPLVCSRFDLGVLSTGAWHFYERLGWERWRGPSYVRAADGQRLRSAAEDDGIMVLRCAPTQAIDRTASITCDERDGDSW